MNKTDRVAINLNINKISLNEKINLKSSIRRIPEFKGVVFWDITTLLKDPVIFKEAIKRLANYYRDKKIDVIVSNEARGFIIGAPLAYELGVGFVPIRKKGKLPYKCLDYTYTTEYSTDSIQIHEDAIEKGQNVLIVDDLLATGGTVKANVEMVEKLGGNVIGLGFLIELEYLAGRKALGNKYDVFSLVNYKTPNDV
jgi:adenine phosphoribosyltransferase